ncbi:MAG TPA: hypothetical protein VF791_08540 [Pyrinomonadaceae bacterium]
MVFALALALIAIAGGAFVTYLFDEEAPLAARLCMGACIGFAALGLCGFILASFLGFGILTLLLVSALLALPLLLLTNARRRKRWQADLNETVRGVRRAILHPARRTNIYMLFYALVVVLLWLVFDRAMMTQPDGILTGVKNNYGDLPFHLSIITRFTDGANFPPEDPTFAGTRFTYPFIADFVAACFVRAGASLRQAMFLENYVLAISFVGLLHRFTLKLTRDWLAGLIAPVLVLFSGGLGWWNFFTESKWSEDGLLGVLFHLEQQFTINDYGYRWGNTLTTLLVPQRSILLGLPLALIVFTLWWTSRPVDEEGKREKVKGKRKETKTQRPSSLLPSSFYLLPSTRRMIAAGAIAGLLPLIHAHTFIVVMMVGAVIFLLTGLKQWRAWIAFFIVAVVIAGPQMWWSTHGSAVRAGDFLGWQPGWDSGKENVFWFWFKNTGLLIPLITLALLWREGKARKPLVPPELLLFYLPFLLCFMIPNLIKLAPWIWDNIKVLFYWFIASVPLVALLLARLLRGRLMLRAASVVLLLTLTLAGMLDVWSVAARVVEYSIFDDEGVAFAERVKEKTPPRSTILHAPTFNSPIFLTGRRTVMGYPGHVISHGIAFQPRQREIGQIYAGGADAETLISKYGVEYLVVGPQERHPNSGLRINYSFLERFQLIIGDEKECLAGEIDESREKYGYCLYKIARP